MIAVLGQILLVDQQVVVLVQFPKLAVNHVEVLVAKEGHYLIDVLFFLQQTDHLWAGFQMYIMYFTTTLLYLYFSDISLIYFSHLQQIGSF